MTETFTELINNSNRLGPDTIEAVDELFAYQQWTADEAVRGKKVRDALAAAVKVIIENVPPSPTRTLAIRKLVDARMQANQAITFGGKF